MASHTGTIKSGPLMGSLARSHAPPHFHPPNSQAPPKERPTKLHSDLKDKIQKTANYFSILTNFFSSLSHIFDASPALKSFATKLSSVGTKIFIYVNSAINTFEQFMKSNHLSAFGYFLDCVITSLTKQDRLFLARGFSTGTYTLANSFSIINDKAEFKNFAEHIKHLGAAIKKSSSNIFSKDFFKNFASSEKSLFGIIGGAMCLMGSAIWGLTPVTKLAYLVRDVGSVLKSVEKLNPGHVKKGRLNYFISGSLAVLGAVFDYIGEASPKLKPILTPMSLAVDGHAKYLLRESQNSGELGS